MRIAGAVLAAALVTGCAKQGAKQEAATVDPQVARLIPHDAIGMAVVEMEKVRNSGLYRKYAAALPELDRAVAAAGFDPRKDITRLVIATDGNRMVAVARGNFDRDKLAETIAGMGATKSESDGWVLFTRGGRTAGFPSPTLAVAASTEGVKAAMARAKENAGLPAHLEKLARGVPSGAAMWGVHWGAVTLNLPRSSNLANLDKLLASMETVTAWANLGDGVEFTIAGETAGEEAARKLQSQIKGIIGLGRLTTPDDQPELLRLYDGIEVRVEGKRVVTRGAASSGQIGQLMPLARRFVPQR